MAYNENDPLHQQFRDFLLLNALRDLAKERPDIAQLVWDGSPEAAQQVAQHNDSVAAQIKQSLPGRASKPAPAGKPNGRRPAFDENGDTTRRVKEILRSQGGR